MKRDLYRLAEIEYDLLVIGEGVLSILENPQLARKLGTQARQMFEINFRFDTFQYKMERILQMVFE